MRSILPSLALPLLAALLPVAACGGSGDTGTTVATSVQRDTRPTVSSADASALVSGNTDFAFALYGGLRTAQPSGNLFYSPYSVSLALAMTYAGAAGTTATQMASALHFTLPASRLGSAFNKLDLAIQAKPASAQGTDGQPFALNLADSLWGDKHISFKQPFVDGLAKDFGAGLRVVDFQGNPSGGEAAINTWVADNTNDKIDPLLGPGAIQSDTAFVIVNAVYFDAAWATVFDKSVTQPGTFTRADGTTVQASMMSSGGESSAATGYAKGTNWQAVDLPYSGGTTSMVIVLPDSGALTTIEQGLSGTFYQSVTRTLAPHDGGINLTMPKFKIHGASVSLVPELKALGMTDAFDGALADFSGIASIKPLWIGDVVHQAFVDVTEGGTVAAAATAVIGRAGAVMVSTPVNVTLDHPFYFFIRDVASNTVLFMGCVDDPTAQ